jgi:6-phosphofructo-2-kinase
MSQIAVHGLEGTSDVRSDPGGEVRPPSTASVTSDPALLPAFKKPVLPYVHSDLKPLPFINNHHVPGITKDGVGAALSDTPAPSAPTSPRL